MKKTFGLLLVVGLLVAGLATAAMAAVPGDGVRDYPAAGSTSGIDYGFGFVDVDGDDVNDNFVDADGDGTCDNFVDVDADGINDLRGTLGTGGGGPHGTGECGGDNFVDADGDGVCDLAGSGGGQKRMHGNGQGGTP